MRQALGRGLDALIPSAATNDQKSGSDGRTGTQKLPIALIRPNRYQPRRNFDAEKLSELSQSIKENGLAQPVLVSYDPSTNTYELIAGERRLKASQLAGLTEIEAVVRPPYTDRQKLALALIENLQREDLNPIEESMGYLRLMKEFGINQTQLADTMGKSKPAISNSLRLLELPDEVQKALQNNQITEGHAKVLLGLKHTVELINLFHLCVANNFSVRELEDMVRKIHEGKKVPEPKTVEAPEKKEPDVNALEDSLKRALGTKVEIAMKGASKGKITLHFYSLTDFEKIVTLLQK